MVCAKMGIKINFQSMREAQECDLEEHYKYLTKHSPYFLPPGFTSEGREPPEGYEDFVCVDVLGAELTWMNEHFPKEKYTWYLWFESIFLVPPNMATYLKLRWE